MIVQLDHPCAHEKEYFSLMADGIACASCGEFLREAEPTERPTYFLGHTRSTAHDRSTITFATDHKPTHELGPLERHLIHQPRQNWSPGTVYRCTHRVKDQDATILVRGFKRGDYRQCTVCGTEVAA